MYGIKGKRKLKKFDEMIMKSFFLTIGFIHLIFGQSSLKMDGNFTLESMSNLSGGVQTETAMSGVGEIGIEYERKNTLFRISSLFLNGESPSDFIGDGFGASNIDGYDSFRLYEIWVEKNMMDKTLNIRFGSLLADAEFSVNDVGGLFINSSFGWPAYISANTINTGPAYFVTAPGVRVKYDISEIQFLQFGVYDGDPFDHPEGDGEVTASGMHWEINKDQGIFSVGEFVSQKNDKQNYIFKLGTWKYTCSEPSSVYFQDQPSRYGYYISTEFGLSKDNSRFPSQGFFRAGWSPNNYQNTYSLAIDGGLLVQNISKSLENDSFGFGIAYASIPDNRFILSEDMLYPMDYECAIECTYQFQIMNHITIQPDIQWILHPGGSALNEDAFVGSIRISHSF